MKLKVECISGPNLKNKCFKIFEISESKSLYDLHLAILTLFDFSCEHAYMFYTGRNSRNISNPLSNSENMEDIERDYKKKKLKDIWALQNAQLFYLYDFGDEWVFKITKMSRKADENKIKGIKILEEHGINPKQYV